MKLKRVTNADGSLYGYRFTCPGCTAADAARGDVSSEFGDACHVIPVAPSPHAWGFNGNEAAPTFTPSILVHPHGSLAGDGSVYQTPQCHSFVTDGRIQFLADCTHPLAGQTVDLPEIS